MSAAPDLKKQKEPIKKGLKLVTGSIDQVRQQMAKLGIELPSLDLEISNEVSTSDKLRKLWRQIIVRPFKGLLRSSMFRTMGLFVATFTTSGALVYFFEHVDGNKDQFVNLWDGIWWGIVTITTTGYGDKFPATLGGRIIAGTTMCIGIVVAGIVTGNIASWLVERRMRESRGLVNLAGKAGHLIICGWRREMPTVLEEIFHLNPGLKTDDVVIIAPISQETLETFKSDERYNHVHILRGDYFSQHMLEHASVKMAQKVIVLSDWSNPRATVTEVDAKTIMTCMTIEKLAPRIYVTAEIIDSRFETYLRIAHVDEIIHTKEFGRSLLVNTSKGAGLAHVLFDLLNVNTPVHLTTAAIPKDFRGTNFGELAHFYRQKYGSILIGLIENTGNLHDMKKEALVEAQKNPDTRTVLKNLKEVRGLTTNHPRLNPPRDYVIKKNTRAVLVENKLLKKTFVQKREVAS